MPAPAKSRAHYALLLAAVLAFGAVAGVTAQEKAPKAPPPPLVLLPPEVPAEACSAEVFNTVTRRYRSCAVAFFERNDPDAECCEGLAEFYGPNSTRPSRNCFCDAGTWKELNTKWKDYTRYAFPTAFLVCARLGYIVPYLDDKNTGYCHGIPPEKKAIAAATMDGQAARSAASAQDYVSRLDQDGLVLLSFITSIISGAGVLLLLWPLVFEAGSQVAHAIRGRGSKAA